MAEHHPNASAETKKLAGSVSHEQLHDFAATKEKGLPIKVKGHKRKAPKPPKKKPPQLKYGN